MVGNKETTSRLDLLTMLAEVHSVQTLDESCGMPHAGAEVWLFAFLLNDHLSPNPIRPFPDCHR